MQTILNEQYIGESNEVFVLVIENGKIYTK
jgi:hypothetical protein